MDSQGNNKNINFGDIPRESSENVALYCKSVYIEFNNSANSYSCITHQILLKEEFYHGLSCDPYGAFQQCELGSLPSFVAFSPREMLLALHSPSELPSLQFLCSVLAQSAPQSLLALLEPSGAMELAQNPGDRGCTRKQTLPY